MTSRAAQLARVAAPVRALLSLRALEPLLVLVATVAAASSFSAFFGSVAWVPPVAGAAAAGVAVGVLSSIRRWRWWLTAGVAVSTFLVLTLYTGYRSALVDGLPGPAALRELGIGLQSGWSKMLDVALPADVVGDHVVVPMLLSLAAGLIGTLLTMRTSRVSVLALPPLLVFAAGLLYTASRPAPRWMLAGIVLLAVLMLVLVRVSRGDGTVAPTAISERDASAIGLDLAAQRRNSTLGRLAFGLPVVAAVTVAAVVAAPILPIADGSDRFDPRALRTQHFRLAPGLSPLVRVKPQLESEPPVPLFSVRVRTQGGTYTVDRVRTAALDMFDGALWTEADDFVIAGSALPPGPRLSRPVVSVQLDVDVTRLPDPFLPEVGRPVRMQAPDTAFDPVNGTLVSTRSSVADYHYTVTGEVRPVDAAAARATVSQAPADLRYAELPDPPDKVREAADEATRGYQTPWTQLLAIEKYLSGLGYSLSARPGHSYGAVLRTLYGATPEDRVGYAEQYASAFAILARAKHYPARVAVGYRLNATKRTGDVYQVDTADAHAWPEVKLVGFGWVPFEPTNTGNAVSVAPPREQTAPVLPDDPARQQPRQPEADNSDAGTQVAGVSFGEQARRAGLGLAVLLAVIVVALMAVAVTKVLRRLRRARRGPPAQRIAAAWRETLDRLRERGVATPPSLTPVEIGRIAAAGRGAVVGAQVAELALVVTTAVCAPVDPPEEAARHAWKLESEIRRKLDGLVPPWVRVRMLLDPRPLLPRWVRPRGAGRSPSSSRARERAGAGSGGAR